MAPKRKRGEEVEGKVPKEPESSKEIDYSKLYCVDISIHEYHLDQHLHEVLLFPTLMQALKHKQEICKTWSDGSGEFDFDSEEFFNDLEFDEDLEGFEDGSHVSISVSEVDLSKPKENGAIFRSGDDCEL